MAPASRREISSSADRISSTASSEESTLRTSSPSFDALHALDQAGGEQPRRIERLQDVVACRRDEPRLREVGGIGFGLGGGQLLVEAGQFGGALGNAALQRFVGALQGLGRQHAFGGIDDGDDHAAIRHRA